jgi:predicted hotdog family 3-hydroxylacyl-ACP dehydratase
MNETAPPIELLVPHRGSARLVERVLAWRDDSLECAGRIPPESPFVSDGSAPSFVGLEFAAQAAAAHEALGRRRAGGATDVVVGYLVRIKEARFGVARLRVGAELRVTVRLVGGAPPLAIYAVREELAGVEYLSATLSLWGSPRLARG